MNIYENMKKSRDKNLNLWFLKALDIFDKSSHQYLKHNTKGFTNPIGSTLHKNLSIVYDILSNEKNNLEDGKKLYSSLDEIIKVFAIQDILPSVACSFIFELKYIIEDNAGNESMNTGKHEELRDVWKKIDQTTGLAFDVYMQKREKLYEIKSNAQMKTFGRLFTRVAEKYENK